MAHFAEIDDSDIVLRIIVIDNEMLLTTDGAESEELGSAYCTQLFGGTWIQTSYNARIRNKYAAIGDRYDRVTDRFLDPTADLIDTDLSWQLR